MVQFVCIMISSVPLFRTRVVHNDLSLSLFLSVFMGIIVFLWSIWWLLDYCCWPVLSIVSTQIGSENVHSANANGNSTALWVFVRIHFEPDLRPDKCAENFASRVKIQQSQLLKTGSLDLLSVYWCMRWNMWKTLKSPKNQSIDRVFFTWLKSQHFALNVENFPATGMWARVSRKINYHRNLVDRKSILTEVNEIHEST